MTDLSPVFEGHLPAIRHAVGVCSCGRSHELPVDEASDRSYFIRDEDRYVRCECEALLDFGVVILVKFEHEVST